MKKFPYSLLLLVTLVLTATPVALATEVDDSLEKQVYECTLTDLPKAQRLMAELRKRGEMPAFRLNCIEGDLFFNSGKYFEAITFYKRAYYDKKRDESYMMELLRRLIMCYDNVHNATSQLYYARKLLDMSTERNDSVMRSIALFCMGNVAYDKGRQDEGLRQMDEATRIMERSSYRSRYDQLYYYYATLVEKLQESSRNELAMSVLVKLDKLVKDDADQTGVPIETLENSRMKDIYAHYAVLLQRLGRDDEAAAYYKKFVDAGEEHYYDYSCIMPYINAKGLYDDIIRFSDLRRNFLKSVGDTMGYDMISVSQTEAEAYMAKGDYRHAAEAYRLVGKLTERVKSIEERGAMDELSSNYEIHDRELEMERTTWRIHMTSVVIIALVIIFFVVYIVYRSHVNNRLIVEKNKAMAKTIGDLIHRQTALGMPVEKSASTDETAQMEQDRALFERVRHEIVDEKAYLDADLSRDKLLEKLCIPKNSFSNLFKTFVGTSYSKFISDLRLEHAVRLINQYPNYTVEAIAAESGFSSVRTFYNLFAQKFGMTPTEYRTARQQNVDEMGESV